MEETRRSLAVADGLLWSILLLSPLAVGTVHVETWTAVAALALLAFLAALHGTPEPPRPSKLALGVGSLWGLALVLQLLPLPAGLVGLLSPAAAEIWAQGPPTGNGGAAAYRVHQAPGEGSLQVLRWLAAAAFASACLVRASDSRWRRRLPVVVLVTALVASAVCLVQTLGESEKLLGLYRPTAGYRSFWRAPLINPNHWTAYLSMAALVGLGLAASRGEGRRGQALLCGFASLLLVLLVCFSPSRGGLLGLGAGAGVLVALRLLRRTSSGRRPRAAVMVFGLVLAVSLVGLAVWGAVLRSEGAIDPYSGEELGGLDEEGRVALLPVAGEILQQHRWAGVGRDALYDVFPRYRDVEGTALARWLEVLPVDILLDFGLLFGGALLLGLGWMLFEVLRQGRRGTVAASAAAALVGLAVHEVGDFSTETGAVLLAALALSSLVLPRAGPAAGGRRPWLAVLAALVLVGLLALPAWTHGDSARCVERLSGLAQEGASWRELAEDEWSHHPSSFPLALAAAVGSQAEGDTATAFAWLNRGQQLAPHHPGPHLRTARLLRQIGASSQALVEYRLAMEGDWRFRARPIFREVAQAYPGVDDLRRLIPQERPEAVAQFAMWLRDLGDPRAVTFGQLALESLDESPATLVAGIYARLDQRRFEEARELIERAWQLEDLDRNIRLRLAVSMGWSGASERELELLRELAAGVERAWPSLWFSLGRAEARAGHAPEARRALRRVSSSSSPRWQSKALLVEAALEEEAGRPDQALRLAQRSGSLFANQADSFAMEARLLQDRGRRDEAMTAAAEALRIDPENSTARRVLDSLAPEPETSGETTEETP